MSAFRGILTGYLGAKIADTEAADRLKRYLVDMRYFNRKS